MAAVSEEADVSQPPRPPESPLAMPHQSLRAAPKTARPRATSKAWRKGFVGAVSVGVTTFAWGEMYLVLNVGGMTALEWVLLCVFCLNLAWIAFAFGSATVGFLVAAWRELRPPKRCEHELTGRTALLFPIYNEDVASVYAGIEAAAKGLRETAPNAFEAFILSDTTDPEVALIEEEAFFRLRERIGEGFCVWYRRRPINTARKSGNVEDFVTRWGGRYDHMIVYDADSHIETETLLELTRRMSASPDTGLIQTIPQLIGGKTLFARTQQFAAALYGPFLGTGVAWWAQDEGNFWGHNAIIRTRAFAEAAGLPTLPGRAPFGGTILSHDFVEAALLRRAGWRVRIASEVGGSFEECPPTIIDLTIRDRRWCQGNLQHAGVLLRAKKLTWTSRLHLMIGVMSYLASPMWLLLILVGMGLSLQGKFLAPDYFGSDRALFPDWPVIDSARALRLFFLTIAILFAPKLYGLLIGLLSKDWRRKVGPIRTVLGVLAETVISALIAPILMAAQTGSVVSILRGKDTGWSPQQRGDEGYRFGDVMRRHAGAMVLGVALMTAALLISPVFAVWLSPAGIGMVLAGPLSWWTGSLGAGQGAKRAGLMLTPTEVALPAPYTDSRAVRSAYEGLTAPSFTEALTDGAWQKRRKALPDPHWPLARGEVHSALATGAAKVLSHASETDLESFLTKAERMALLDSPTELSRARRRVRAARAERTKKPALRIVGAQG
ncbi:glucans biosynthesis glucosyltransferase MdoH [Parvularcula dongshanensis]|uniref:glucans biosynthesis glucosyltransferase MdoH n=1 Tax=Parvularcula dongshanensis TaxID=1173995 RepID=UPI0031B5BF1A